MIAWDLCCVLPRVPANIVRGQVINQVLKSNNVWLDHEDANASRRYKLADTGGTDPATGAFAASYRLWSSADGVHVSAATLGSGRGCGRCRGWL